MKRVQIERVLHKGASRIALKFSYDEELIAITRNLPGAKWSSTMRCWHIEEIPDPVHTIFEAFRGSAILDYSRMRTLAKSDVNAEANRGLFEAEKANSSTILSCDLNLLSSRGKEDIEKYRRWMAANRYPESTIRTYSSMMIKFLQFIKPREAEECTEVDITEIVSKYILPNKFSQSFQNQMISSIKKFYTYIYHKTIDPGSIERPRPRHILPNVLSKDEVKRILSSLPNEKHRTMLSMIYACGLRRSELINLIPADIERLRGLIRIRQAKGFKDRVVPVSEKTIQMIDNYVLHYKPENFLFEGQRIGEKYSASSLEKILKNACHKSGIKKPVTLHWLRHSYATHLLESGTDLRYIQELLGHKSSRTTEIYTHVTTSGIQKIRSPFDDL